MADSGDPTSQTTRALLRLRELILRGEFAPGTRMVELALVQRLGVSRTPLRLALSTLGHEGLLRPLAGGGYAVREFSQGDIDDAIELRGLLEGTAARFAAERGDNADALDELRAINDEIHGEVRKADYASFERYVGFNERFHAVMLAAARSPLLERALEQTLSLPFASPSAFVLTEAELPESREILVVAHSQHRSLIDAIEREEGARAESLGREHARLARRNLDVVLRERQVRDLLPGAPLVAVPDDPAPTVP